MPAPATSESPRPRSRRALIAVAVVFLVPMALALVLHLAGWRPEGRSLEHGELLQPVRPMPDVQLRMSDGTTELLSAWRHRWVMLYAGRLPCDVSCEAALDKLHRVWLAQGREAERIRPVFMVLAGTPTEIQKVVTSHPGLIVVSGERDAIQRLARGLVSHDGTALDGRHRLYLIDPLGNLVLSYPPDADPSGIRKDVARLLRLSQVG